jgi:hypothetical protein
LVKEVAAFELEARRLALSMAVGQGIAPHKVVELAESFYQFLTKDIKIDFGV